MAEVQIQVVVRGVLKVEEIRDEVVHVLKIETQSVEKADVPQIQTIQKISEVLEVYVQEVVLHEEWEKPIVRVVNLLKDMAAELDKEATPDLKNTALASTRENEIAALTDEAAALTKALGEAKALRDKKNDEINMMEKDLIQSIHSLKNAVMQLGKSHGEQPAEELLQQQQSSLMQVRHARKRIPELAVDAVAPRLRSQARELLRAQEHPTTSRGRAPSLAS